MNAIESHTDRYARCVQTSKRVRWDIDKDVIRGRRFDAGHKFLPDGLSLANTFTTLSADPMNSGGDMKARHARRVLAVAISHMFLSCGFTEPTEWSNLRLVQPSAIRQANRHPSVLPPPSGTCREMQCDDRRDPRLGCWDRRRAHVIMIIAPTSCSALTRRSRSPSG
jgi:hypothetical protein